MTTRFEHQRDDEMAVIALAYTLHNLYTAWEAYFYRVAKFFENKLPPETWHRELLARMELDIPGIRPAVFDADTGAAFDELRRFRHIFRNLYKSKLQRERVDWVNRQAVECYENFRTSHENFIRWIDGLIEIEERTP